MTPSTLIQITPETHGVLIDLMYAKPDNFVGHVVYDSPLCFLHPHAEAALRRAVSAARRYGFTFKILDAYRPQAAQEALWAAVPNPDYVADPAKGSNHTRGVAVDLTLIDSQGRELDMGTPADTMTPASHHFQPVLSSQVQVNRMYLLTLMLEAGFVHHPHEWWHYQLPDAERFALIEAPGPGVHLTA